ncbi:MAG: FGGY family carbohydrate kinase, partial [Actinomycetota bacterium]|nr:FGGY family carbohydrate kinase [Actinomycetota bacterium]
MSVAVGLDIGTSGLKALAVAEDGEIVGRAEREYGLSTPQPGWAEQNPEDWWRATEAALADLGVDEVSGIGLSGQMHGLVALDADEAVLRPAILWNDQRTGAECEEIEERIGLEALIAATGNRALTGFTAPKLLWLERHEPEVHERIAHILLPKDYVRLRLCGERAIDVADASGTLLFDVAHREWSTEVCEALGVPAEWLPRALESPAVSGETADGTPVAAGAGD